MHFSSAVMWVGALFLVRCGNPEGDSALGSVQQMLDDRSVAVPAAGQLYHGVFPAGSTEPDSDISFTNLADYEQTVGRPAAYVYFSNNWYRSKAFPMATARKVRDRGSVPFIRLMMRSQQEGVVTDPRYTLQRIINGEFDGELNAWADGAIAFGTPLIVEYGTEVNGDWFPWSAPYNGGKEVGAARFRAAYRHIVQRMRARGARNITWAFHVNSENFPEYQHYAQSYYPGDDVVDWVGMSVYGSERPYDYRCHPFTSLVDAMMEQLRAATRSKPVFIFEVGITGNNPNCDANRWMSDAFASLLGGRWPEMRGFAWWNERWKNNSNPAQDTNMLVQQMPNIASVFRQVLTGSTAGRIVDRPIFQQPQGAPVPVITLTGSAPEGEAPLTEYLDGTESYSNVPGRWVVGYEWNFGDGTPVVRKGWVAHTYVNPGTYQATLTVTDNAGERASKSITIRAVPRGAPAAVIVFDGSQSYGTAPFTAYMDGTRSWPRVTPGWIASYRWNFGDGSPIEAGGWKAHRYSTPGNYRVTLTVTDNRGVASSTSVDIRVCATAACGPP
jgi:PKD repeat protein